jgi:hypothetical protein
VDEYWKGKSVTPVPTTDERVPTITRVCPSLKEYLHSPCGYASPTQPDLYVSEEWFGLMAGADTRSLFSSTSAVSDTKNTLDTP